MQNLSRRNFFKLGAGVLAGAALFDLTGLNHKAFAQKITPSNFKINPIKLSDLPPATKAPLNSQLVNNAYDYIISSVEKITDNKLRQQTLDLIKDTRPKFMQLYTSSTDVTNIYNELANKGLIDTSIISPEQLFPPLKSNKNPQDFISAPGSGYASHHSYPGGLPTHTAANLSISEGVVNTYKLIFGYAVNTDIVLSAQALHDLAKPWVFQWNEDGTCLSEYSIAGTGAHHILGLVEAIYRNLPAEEIVAQACAHNHPGSDKDEESVVNWIKAASRSRAQSSAWGAACNMAELCPAMPSVPSRMRTGRSLPASSTGCRAARVSFIRTGICRSAAFRSCPCCCMVMLTSKELYQDDRPPLHR